MPPRDRTPRGAVPKANPNHTVAAASIASNAMLQIAASQPFQTQRPPFNTFVPDAQMLFHVLGICDQRMTTTRQFLRSSPSWLPIVSQLYISLLWNLTILRNFVDSKHGVFFQYARILNDLDFVNHCMIPGPLVIFFESLACYNGYVFDITPVMPHFTDLWNASRFHPNADYARQIPIPAIILDQLYHFATYNNNINDVDDDSFLWYSNVFSQGIEDYNKLNRIGPQLCGSLYASRQQSTDARSFWKFVFEGDGFKRVNAADNAAPPFTSINNLLTLNDQFGNSQFQWFKYASVVMHKYSQYFKGSVPLSSILLHPSIRPGSVAIRGVPSVNEATRNFLYPTDAEISPFPTSSFHPRRQFPYTMSVTFQHSEYHGLEKEAEQTAMVAHSNLIWPAGNAEQNEWSRINSDVTHKGDVWSLRRHRFSPPVSLNIQYDIVITSRYHIDDAYSDSDD